MFCFISTFRFTDEGAKLSIPVGSNFKIICPQEHNSSMEGEYYSVYWVSTDIFIHLLLPVHELCYRYMNYATCIWTMLPVHELCYMYMNYATWNYAYATCTWTMVPVHELWYLYMKYATCTWTMLPVRELCYMK